MMPIYWLVICLMVNLFFHFFFSFCYFNLFFFSSFSSPEKVLGSGFSKSFFK